MAPINADADVAEVVAQLSALRLRSNGLLAQRTASYAVSTALLAAAATVATALRGNAELFAATAGVAGVATLGAMVACVWHLRVQWQSLRDTAHLADTGAALDERLTTLLTAAAPPSSSLRPLLIEQLLAARQCWSVAVLAPRRVARAVALVPMSLALFAATAFYSRPPADPHPLATPRATHLDLSTNQRGKHDNTHQRGGAGRGPLAPDSDSAASTAADADGGRHAGDSATASARRGGSASGSADSQMAGDPLATSNGPHPLSPLQQSIREALGATGPRNGSAEERPPQQRAANGTADSGHAQFAGDPGDRSSQHDGRQNVAARSEQSSQLDGPANPSQASSGRGGAGMRGAGAMFGHPGQVGDGAGDAAPMAIKLSAISGVSPSQQEPQHRAAALPSAPTTGSRSSRSLPEMATQQVADAAIHKLDLGPEHEGVVRRIFTRQ